MSAAESILSGFLPLEIGEAIRTLLSLKSEPYFDLPAEADGPGICVGTSSAAVRRFIESEHEKKLTTQPKVPVNYRLGGRQRLPESRNLMPEKKRLYRDIATETETTATEIERRFGTATDVATQTPSWPGTLPTGQVESAPEGGKYMRKKRRMPLLARVIYSSSDTVPVVDKRSSQQLGSQQRKQTPKRAADRSDGEPPAKRPARAGSCTVVPDSEASDGGDEDDGNEKGIEPEQDDGTPVENAVTPATPATPNATCPPDITTPPAHATPSLTDIPKPLADIPNAPGSARPSSSSPMPETIVSSVEGRQPTAQQSETMPTPVVPSSQESSSSHSGSETQNRMGKLAEKQHRVAELEREARTALHRLESATGILVAARHRSDLIDHVLALGGFQALENLRLTLGCWQIGYESMMSRMLVLDRPDQVRQAAYPHEPALDRFSVAYRSAVDATLCRAAIDVLYRIRLAFLYEVYLETLAALSHLTLQPAAPRLTPGSRALDVFNEDVRETATDQMFWACHPKLDNERPRSDYSSINRKFKATLASAERWHRLRGDLSLGALALIPPRANRWVERLPVGYLSLYTTLIKEVNPVAVSMGEMITERVRRFWQNEAPPESRLLLESLVTDQDISMYAADPLRLLEEVYPDGRQALDRGETGRAATVPADLDVNNAAAVAEFAAAAFSGVPRQDRNYAGGDWMF
jgi:hypothetical protein